MVSAQMTALPDLLGRLKLTAMRDRLEGLLDEAEMVHREERRIQMGMGIAKFPYARTLEGFNFVAQPSLDPKHLRDLAACRWVENGDTLLIQGPPGAGKSHLAVALGREAVRQGYSVLFTSAVRNSMLVTSNRSVSEWGTVLNDQVAAAILDRLLHHSHVLTIRGHSYRLREKRRSGLLKRGSADASSDVV